MGESSKSRLSAAPLSVCCLGAETSLLSTRVLVTEMGPASGRCAPTKSRRLPSAQSGIWLALDGHSLSTQPPVWGSECICPNPEKLTTQAGHESNEWALKKEVFTFHTL